MWVYLNGEIIPADEAKISPLDRSFTFGDGVYEVIPSYNKELFLFEEHLQRFKISLAKLLYLLQLNSIILRIS